MDALKPRRNVSAASLVYAANDGVLNVFFLKSYALGLHLAMARLERELSLLVIP